LKLPTSALAVGNRALGFLSALREAPVLGPVPCAPKCQRARKLALPLPRLPAPEVSVLILAVAGKMEDSNGLLIEKW